MTVLVVTSDFPPTTGGIQTLVSEMCGHFRAWHPVVIAPRVRGHEAFDAKLPFPVYRVPFGGRMGRLGKTMAIAAMLMVALVAAWRHRADAVLCAHVIVSPIGWVLRLLWGVPYAVCVHADEVVRTWRVMAFTLGAADRILASSTYSRALITKQVRDPRKIIVTLNATHSPVSLPHLGALVASHETKGTTILTVARMDELYKGHDIVIRSLPLVAATVPEVRYVLIGAGRFQDYYRRIAESLNVSDRVRFLGEVSNEVRNQWLETCDVFVMVSRVHPLDGAGEGFGIAYLEAGARGKPVVAGRAGGALDAVADGETGLLVEPESVPAVAEALIRVLTDTDLAARLGEQGRRRVETDFTWEILTERVEEILNTMVHDTMVHERRSSSPA